MNLNADFTLRAAVHGAASPWVASPTVGVDRRMLDRIGGEVARATSIVRYAPASRFPAHTHGGGEEFLVLEGVFQDEHGDFPAGTYVRNPPTSRHMPGSDPGCVILVKLWQFDTDDRTQLRIDTTRLEVFPDPARPGVEAASLFRDGREAVRMERWLPDREIRIDAEGGAEVFVLEGGFSEGGETFGPHGWLRLPAGADGVARVGAKGARVWIKTGHLREGLLNPPPG
ncbi:cupin domain-containing protein [Elioraea sp.]|uniref:cupin domain-containing protein n=1 Tax=Elioraea sp. TaxID=2185103 RepID=UPI0025C4FC33|nr:cupin domain-containing protein [Elioraea sp.]